MPSSQVILVGLVFFLCKNATMSSETTYYAVTTFQENYDSIFYRNPPYGSIFSYQPISSNFSFFLNYTFHINDSSTDLYQFEPGPVATVLNDSSLMYMSIESATAFQCLFLLSFDMKQKSYKQSRWLLADGSFAYLFHDPLRQRLIGLRDIDTFTLIIEEYHVTTLDVVRKYTQQDGEEYAFPFEHCSIFDYEENWIVEVRTRAEDLSVNAYFVKMDLNLVGKKENIVVEFQLMPDVKNLCTMTYDIKRKLILATWQHGSIDQDVLMLYMNPYTTKFSNETLLLETPKDMLVQNIQAVYNEKTREILFLIEHQQDPTYVNTYWMLIVEFDTMKVKEKKQVTTILDFDQWELFLV